MKDHQAVNVGSRESLPAVVPLTGGAPLKYHRQFAKLPQLIQKAHIIGGGVIAVIENFHGVPFLLGLSWVFLPGILCSSQEQLEYNIKRGRSQVFRCGTSKIRGRKPGLFSRRSE